MLKGLIMNIEGVGVGLVIGLVMLFFIGMTAAISSDQTENKIASSCDLSQHVVINDKAYKCELMK
jgi:hypothetical protein